MLWTEELEAAVHRRQMQVRLRNRQRREGMSFALYYLIACAVKLLEFLWKSR